MYTGKEKAIKQGKMAISITWVDPEDMTKNEIRQTQKENTVGPKCEVPGVAGFTETERGRAGVTGWGRGEGVTI